MKTKWMGYQAIGQSYIENHVISLYAISILIDWNSGNKFENSSLEGNMFRKILRFLFG